MDITQKVIKIVAEELGFNEDKVKMNSNFIEDLAADSLDTVELILKFEEEFDIEIPDEDARKITTVEKAIEYLKTKVK
jgi:acyl carrier protein